MTILKRNFTKNNKGFGVIEVVLLIIVVIALVFIFQEEVIGFVKECLAFLRPTSEEILQDTNLIS